MKNKNIPAGYQLHVHCWENDADNYSLSIISGLSKGDIDFYVHLLSKFKSKNSPRDQGLGNDYVPSEKIVLAINDSLEKYGAEMSEALKASWLELVKIWNDEDDDDGLTETMWTILGTPGEYYFDGEHPFYRVFDRYQVFYFPQEVEDVTQQFLYKR